MYKEILEALKTKYAGVSEKILDRIAKKLTDTVTNAEDVTTAVEGVTFQQILDSYGDSRATEATKTAVLNYEKKYGIKDGEKVVKQEPATLKNNEDEPEWAKKLAETVINLSERVNAIQGEKLKNDRKQKLNEVLGTMPESLRKGYQRIAVESMDDDAFSQLLSEVTTEVSDINKSQAVKGAVFGKPTAAHANVTSSKEQASEEETNAVVQKLNI